MLSIILLREREQYMFEQTKEWLESNKDNIFYLIIDELHSYRGTGGTEISYTIKSFLHRLGLSPNSPQLRIIATSASLSPKNGQKFLSDFFGTDIKDNEFKVIDGTTEEINYSAIKNIKNAKKLFEVFHNSGANEESLIQFTNHF